MTKLCDILIHILEYWCSNYEDYAILNIMLFVIIQPMLILTFMISTIHCSKTKKEHVKKIWRYFTWSMMVFWIAFTALMVVIPVTKDKKIKQEIKEYLSIESGDYMISPDFIYTKDGTRITVPEKDTK